MFILESKNSMEKVKQSGCSFTEQVFFKYILDDGKTGTYYYSLTPKKTYPLLSAFEYIQPNEFGLFKQNIKEPSKEDKEIIKNYYIGTNRSWILNNKLRKGEDLSIEEKKVYNILKDVCYQNRCGKNCILTRMVDLNFLAQYNISFDKFDENSSRNALEKIKNDLVYNIVRKENGFMSASYGKNGFFNREVMLLLYTPCGIRMYVTDNDAETEVIFEDGMRYYFVDAYLEKVTNDDKIFYRIVLCCLMLGAR